MKKLSLFSLIAVLITSLHAIDIPEESEQLVVVTTADWSTKEGKLQRYEKNKNKWLKVGNEIEII